jgi:general secretion pathway protein C
MVARFIAFSVWLLLGGSVAYWGLQLFARPLPMPESVLSAGQGRSGPVDLGRLLGVTPPEAAAAPEVPASTRLRLLGVVAPKNPKAAEAGEGVALIEVDGVARTVRVGAVVDGELRLLRVDARTASLGLMGQAPVQVLQISPPAAPATGSLPPAQPSNVVLGGNPDAGAAGLPLRANPPAPAVAPVPAAMPSVYGAPPAGQPPRSDNGQPQER